MTTNDEALEELNDEQRLALKAGDRVMVTMDDGAQAAHVVSSAPWQLGHGEWVVGLQGRSGGYLLSRVWGKFRTKRKEMTMATDGNKVETYYRADRRERDGHWHEVSRDADLDTLQLQFADIQRFPLSHPYRVVKVMEEVVL